MSRYKNTIVINDKVTQNRKLKSTEYPKIEFKDSDIIHVTRFDESYMSLAHKFYNDQSLWWIIAEANQLKDGGFALEPDIELRIPRNIAPILQEFRNINEEFLNR